MGELSMFGRIVALAMIFGPMVVMGIDCWRRSRPDRELDLPLPPRRRP